MTRAAVDQLLYLLDHAFERAAEGSLTANLREVGDGDWLWKPPGGARSIADIVGHVAACKHVYANHAFGDASMTWLDPAVDQAQHHRADAIDATALIDWLRDGQQTLRGHVAALGDDDLLRPRMTPWGKPAETRWIISTMIEHDLYHVGEVNHIRAMRHGNDPWAWERESP